MPLQRLVALLACLSLGACSFASAITRSSIDYNETVEDVTNNMLVVNILRARDGVPLYFTDLSQLRGSMTVQATAAASVPFGNSDIANQKTRNIATAGLQLSTSPSFDLAPLNNKDFSNGLLTPIDVKYMQEYLQQGVPQNLLMHLMVDRIEFLQPPTRTEPLIVCSYQNTPRSFGVGAGGPCPPGNLPRSEIDFESTVAGWNLPLIIHSYTALQPFGPPLAISPGVRPSDLANTAKDELELRPLRGQAGRFQLYTKRQAIAFCVPALDAYFPADVSNGVLLAPKDACYENQVIVNDPTNAGGPPQIRVSVYLRSIQGMFQYLGELVQIEKNNEALIAQGKRPAPLPLRFYIQEGLSADARFNVFYNGQVYHVEPNKPGTDDTLRVLSILNQLLNTIKNAAEIPSTKAVEALP
jgi:hypothetical protein